MAGSLNKVSLIGNLGKDPEIRNAQSGMKIVNLTVATSESWNDKASGERKELTEWHRVVIMNERLGEIAERYLKKGAKVYLEGKLQTRKWTDNSGQEKYTTEVMLGRFGGELVMLGNTGGGGGGEDYAPRAGRGQAGAGPQRRRRLGCKAGCRSGRRNPVLNIKAKPIPGVRLPGARGKVSSTAGRRRSCRRHRE